ncbi:MAG: YkgJ family cysteine cluster protein, partial [Desulfobacterota bacterium]|nr:YkgJ family cysteine cluster protein [Thermodesulfobacteriota bacterium]
VEFFFLRRGFNFLGWNKKKIIRERMPRNFQEISACILLENGKCILYDYRPIICRTQGLPLLITENGITKKDCCPKNFTSSLASLPLTDFLHLERLNTILVAINQQFALQLNIEGGKRSFLTELISLVER